MFYSMFCDSRKCFRGVFLENHLRDLKLIISGFTKDLNSSSE